LIIKIGKTDLFIFDFDQSGRRGHSKKLFNRRSRLDIWKFALAIEDRLNALSICCVKRDSINCFESQIKKNGTRNNVTCWYL